MDKDWGEMADDQLIQVTNTENSNGWENCTEASIINQDMVGVGGEDLRQETHESSCSESACNNDRYNTTTDAVDGRCNKENCQCNDVVAITKLHAKTKSIEGVQNGHTESQYITLSNKPSIKNSFNHDVPFNLPSNIDFSSFMSGKENNAIAVDKYSSHNGVLEELENTNVRHLETIKETEEDNEISCRDEDCDAGQNCQENYDFKQFFTDVDTSKKSYNAFADFSCLQDGNNQNQQQQSERYETKEKIDEDAFTKWAVQPINYSQEQTIKNADLCSSYQAEQFRGYDDGCRAGESNQMDYPVVPFGLQNSYRRIRHTPRRRKNKAKSAPKFQRMPTYHATKRIISSKNDEHRRGIDSVGYKKRLKEEFLPLYHLTTSVKTRQRQHHEEVISNGRSDYTKHFVASATATSSKTNRLLSLNTSTTIKRKTLKRKFEFTLNENINSNSPNHQAFKKRKMIESVDGDDITLHVIGLGAEVKENVTFSGEEQHTEGTFSIMEECWDDNKERNQYHYNNFVFAGDNSNIIEQKEKGNTTMYSAVVATCLNDDGESTNKSRNIASDYMDEIVSALNLLRIESVFREDCLVVAPSLSPLQSQTLYNLSVNQTGRHQDFGIIRDMNVDNVHYDNNINLQPFSEPLTEALTYITPNGEKIQIPIGSRIQK